MPVINIFDKRDISRFKVAALVMSGFLLLGYNLKLSLSRKLYSQIHKINSVNLFKVYKYICTVVSTWVMLHNEGIPEHSLPL